MSYKTILLHLNAGHPTDAIIKAGVSVAEKHGAHLIGVYVVPPVLIYSGVPIPKVVNTFHNDYHTNLSSSAEKEFSKYTDGRSFTSEWRMANAGESSIINIISKMAHTSDLLIVGNDTSDKKDPLPGNQLENIITSTCRPTLIIPIDQEITEIGNNILIAWDGTDESTRAVFDSLPLLKHAKEVTILRVNPTGDERHHTIGTSSELVATLGRHGVNVELSFTKEPPYNIGQELLRVATEKGADTIVMGAFGHSRVHGLFLGSVTGDVLENMKIPVLMSH